MIIKFYRKNVFGVERLYLASEENDASWQGLTGRKTITKDDMKFLTELTGVEFIEVNSASSEVSNY